MSNPMDSSPLLSSPTAAAAGRSSSGRRLPSLTLRGAVRFLQRNTPSRRSMSEPSVLVREVAAEQLEERQGDWAYSRPVVLLDTLWNLAFVAAAIGIFVSSKEERPAVPLRLWIVGYALQCVLHVVCVVVEYGRRRRRRLAGRFVEAAEEEEPGLSSGGTSVIKHLESANTMFSFIWWIIGFYWVSAGGQDLIRDAPQLYWICIIFLAFDVFFVVFCVALACFIGIAVCCCLPCIIALLYAVVDQEGATEEDIRQLPKYKFKSAAIMTEVGADNPSEYTLSAEDAECCICLSPYDDGVELRELPCGHNFHCACIDKWLQINAICPLCKYNIIKSSFHGRDHV